jgi:hypothetical protein
VKKGGKLHIGGNSNPLVPFTDFNGVDGFVPSPWDVVDRPCEVGSYVTGREDDEAVGDGR